MQTVRYCIHWECWCVWPWMSPIFATEVWDLATVTEMVGRRSSRVIHTLVNVEFRLMTDCLNGCICTASSQELQRPQARSFATHTESGPFKSFPMKFLGLCYCSLVHINLDPTMKVILYLGLVEFLLPMPVISEQLCIPKLKLLLLFPKRMLR